MTFRNQELSNSLAYWRNHFTYLYFSFVIYFPHFFSAVLYYPRKGHMLDLSKYHGFNEAVIFRYAVCSRILWGRGWT